MIRNIKTDIIYYNSQKDFEFEFTLCAACRMRLLTDMATDKNSLLLSLSRSVSRSQIVILYADLTDDFVRTIAEAIGYNTQEIDYDTYGITFYENRAIIENAVPLVTDEGRFGGLILESGPQSLIFISSDKTVSKEIMKTYVYQYIKDVSEIPNDPIIKAGATEETVDNYPVTDEIVNEIFEAEKVEETQIAETIAEEVFESDIISTNNIILNSDETLNDMTDNNDYFENIKYEECDTDDENDITIKRKLDIPTLILTIILLLLVAVIAYLLIIEPLSRGISIIDNIKQLFSFGK